MVTHIQIRNRSREKCVDSHFKKHPHSQPTYDLEHNHPLVFHISLEVDINGCIWYQPPHTEDCDVDYNKNKLKSQEINERKIKKAVYLCN